MRHVSFGLVIVWLILAAQPVLSQTPIGLGAPSAENEVVGRSMVGSDDASILVIGSDNRVTIWDPASDSEKKQIPVTDHSFSGEVVDVSVHGEYAVLSNATWSVDTDGIGHFSTSSNPSSLLYLLDLQSGQVLWEKIVADFGTYCGASFADVSGRPIIIISGTFEFDLGVLDAHSGNLLANYAGVFRLGLRAGNRIVNRSAPPSMAQWLIPNVSNTGKNSPMLATLAPDYTLRVSTHADLGDVLEASAPMTETGPWGCYLLSSLHFSVLHGQGPSRLPPFETSSIVMPAYVYSFGRAKHTAFSTDGTLIAVGGNTGLNVYRVNPNSEADATPYVEAIYIASPGVSNAYGLAATNSRVFLLGDASLKVWSIPLPEKHDAWRVR